ELPAPVAGFVARRNVQLGQRVSSGTPLMAVVPLDQVWVDANFKEPQLERMRVGQPVRLTADLYGTRLLVHGSVAGFGAGTGPPRCISPPGRMRRPGTPWPIKACSRVRSLRVRRGVCTAEGARGARPEDAGHVRREC